jgi:predicted nucleotidyltransferase
LGGGKMKNIEKILIDFFKEAEGIWIFGSFADNTYNEKSDIDIAVLFKEKKSPVEIFKMQEELYMKLNKDIDLVDLANVNDVFAYRIVTSGRKLKSTKFSENYEYRIWLRYLTLQDDRKIILEDFLNG